MTQPTDHDETNVWKTTGQDLARLVQTKGFWIGVVALVFVWLLVTGDVLQTGMFFFVLALLYFMPAVIARKKPNASSVFVINLFFGWTIVGWVIALAMAVNNPTPPVVVQQAPPAEAERTCPFCAEQVKPAAVVCKHCGRDISPS